MKQVLEQAEVDRLVRNKAPKPPTAVTLIKAKQIYEILLPFGVATDKLQAGSITSNCVLLSLVTSQQSKLSFNHLHYSTYVSIYIYMCIYMLNIFRFK